MKTNLSNLWKKEDWLAVWIGFAVIAIACIAVLTGAFDFAAAKFSTWHLWENVAEKKSLFAQLNGAFWVKLLRTFLVLGVLFTLGVKLQGGKIKEYIPEFEMEYDVDPLRQGIADSWPNKLDDTCARVEWDWKPEYNLDGMTRDMIEKLRIKFGLK